MSSSTIDLFHVSIRMVEADAVTLTVDLSGGRTLAAPLAWYPRLLHASAEERQNWRLIGKVRGIHWEDLDEDISVENLILGQVSGESQESFERWLSSRKGR